MRFPHTLLRGYCAGIQAIAGAAQEDRETGRPAAQLAGWQLKRIAGQVVRPVSGRPLVSIMLNQFIQTLRRAVQKMKRRTVDVSADQALSTAASKLPKHFDQLTRSNSGPLTGAC
ncbi:hypothetical protein HaLaN_28383 [Haematococcus lacustris]|uniref:Uncharacterized protein n=1 Tax=Haematococcus lacustris TaxID=44745 RepID=A0A6A0ACB1_HAELA|nr:hypothetical protein HaLaN_28383 [Haematococcus lacustris]